MKKWLMIALAPCLVASVSAQDQALVKAAEDKFCQKDTAAIAWFPLPPDSPVSTFVVCVASDGQKVIRIQCDANQADCYRPHLVLHTSVAEHLKRLPRYLASQKE